MLIAQIINIQDQRILPAGAILHSFMRIPILISFRETFRRASVITIYYQDLFYHFLQIPFCMSSWIWLKFKDSEVFYNVEQNDASNNL